MNKTILSIFTVCCLLFFSSFANARVEFNFAPPITTESAPLDIASNIDGSVLYVLTAGGKLLVYSSSGKLEQSVQVDPAMDRIDATGLKTARIPDQLFLSSSKTKKIQAVSIETIEDINIAESPFRGPGDAPVTIVIFSDFECPACSQTVALLDSIHKDNPQTVKIVFKHFPLPNHPKARPAAWASIAAHNQGKFWEYHDLLFQNQKDLSQEKYEEFAQRLGLNIEQFKTDMTAMPTKEFVSRDYNEGRLIPITGTPTLFVNGRTVQNRGVMQSLIDEELARLKKK